MMADYWNIGENECPVLKEDPLPGKVPLLLTLPQADMVDHTQMQPRK